MSPIDVPGDERADLARMSQTASNIEAGATPASFYKALGKALKKRRMKIEAVCPAEDAVARRVLEEYGAMFVANSRVAIPPRCIFTSEQEVAEFQNRAGFSSAVIAGSEIELQPAALKALLEAREKAIAEGLDITPRDGTESARRGYDDTVHLWYTRFLPALDYWTGQGKLTSERVAHLRSLPLASQVGEVLDLEKEGLFFSKDFSKSILYSVAAPGASQHIAMLAVDVTEFENARARQILADHGWFQTVLSDLPHFTFLGLEEKELPKHGLRPVMSGEQVFWIPNVTPDQQGPK